VIISLTILSTHLLWCLCRNERIITHDTFQDTIPAIVLESGKHVQTEVSHLFFRYTQWWMDILITKDDFWTLMDVIIANSIRTNMLQWTLMMITHVAMMAIQRKHDHMLSEHHVMTSFPLLLKPMGVFILVLIYFWLLVHKPISRSSTIFFSPFDACFLLSTMHVCSPITCISHKDSSTGYCTWLGFLISSTHQS